MKISKKTIIIIIIVVAVAAWLLWKRKGTSPKEGDASSEAPSGPVPGTLDYYLANIAFTTAERNKILAVKDAVTASTTWREQMQAKANANGHTFDQQIVLDAIWLLYHPNEAWIAGPNGSTSYGWNLQQKVINL